jgi:hypothetical protein
MALAAAVPYLVYIAVNGGVMRYLSQGVRFSAAEAAENGLVLPLVGTGLGLHPNSEALLFFLFYLLPVIAGVVLALRWRQTRDTDMLARVAPLVVIAVVVNRGFLRDELATRLADAIVPAALTHTHARRADPASRRPPRPGYGSAPSSLIVALPLPLRLQSSAPPSRT